MQGKLNFRQIIEPWLCEGGWIQADYRALVVQGRLYSRKINELWLRKGGLMSDRLKILGCAGKLEFRASGR